MVWCSASRYHMFHNQPPPNRVHKYFSLIPRSGRWVSGRFVARKIILILSWWWGPIRWIIIKQGKRKLGNHCDLVLVMRSIMVLVDCLLDSHPVARSCARYVMCWSQVLIFLHNPLLSKMLFWKICSLEKSSCVSVMRSGVGESSWRPQGWVGGISYLGPTLAGSHFGQRSIQCVSWNRPVLCQGIHPISVCWNPSPQ